MQHYYNFKRQAQITYHTAIVVDGRKDFDSALRGYTYLMTFLNGLIDGMILTEVCTLEEIKACRKYAVVVEKAYRKNYIKVHYGK